MKKRIISGIFAALFAVSAVTGISAASDSVFQEEIQDEFQDADGDEDIFMPGDETEKADDEDFQKMRTEILLRYPRQILKKIWNRILSM